MKIWLLDSGDWSDHGKITEKIVKYISPNCDIERIKFPELLLVSDVIDSLMYVSDRASSGDIVLITWILPRNQKVDDAVLSLSKKARVICSAGNLKQDIKNFSPANLSSNIEVVHCLNKKGDLASFSNFGEHTVGMFGTNISIDNLKYSGTTISAAIYAGLISRNSNPKFLDRVTRFLFRKFSRDLNAESYSK